MAHNVEARTGGASVGEAEPGTRSPGRKATSDSRLLTTLTEISASAGRALDAAEVVKLVAERACELLAGDAVALYLWDEPAGALVPVYSNDPRAPTDDQPLRPGQGAAGQAVQRREAVVVVDYPHWEHAVPWAIERGLQAIDSVPLLVADRSIGALAVRFYRPRTPAPEEERILGLLAAQVAPALEAARLYATSQRERERERALREITQALAANLDERHVLDLAVLHSARLLSAPYARIWLFESNGELVCAAAEGFVHAHTFQRRLGPDSTSGQAARQPVLNLANAPAEPGWRVNRSFGTRTGLGAYLGAGLWRAGESLGVLEVMRETGRRFTPADEQLLASLASAVAVAVSNARLHAEAERLAREAQLRADELAISAGRLRTVYEAIACGVLVFDGQGAVIHANPVAEEILGRSVDQLRGQTSYDFLPGLSDTGSILSVEERPTPMALRTRRAVRGLILGIQRPDGQRRWLRVDAVPLVGQDGAVTQVVSSFIDITDQKLSEQALRQRDAILEAVGFAAEQLLTAHDWEHSIDTVLRQLGASTGVSRVYVVPARRASADAAGDDAVGAGRLQWHEWVAEGVRPRTRPQADGSLSLSYLAAVGLVRWEEVLREGGVIQGRRHSFPDDERAALEAQGVCSIVAVPIFAGQSWWGFMGFDDCRDERDWPVGVVEVLKTAAGTLGAAIERRRAEAERLRLVAAESAHAEAEAARRRLAFLAEASRILGSSLESTTSLQSVARLAVPGLADCCLIELLEADRTIHRAAAAHGDPATETWLRTSRSRRRIDARPGEAAALVLRSGQSLLYPRVPAGLLRSLRTTGRAARRQLDMEFTSGLLVPLTTRRGTIGVITWLVTAKRRPYEERDLRLAEDLARRCAMAIDNAALYREAREAITTRDEFLSVAAHELKTPMTSLRGYAQLLAREFEKGEVPSPERARRAALTIQIQSDKLARLVAQLLDVSRIQSGRLALDRKPTDLSRLVREIVEAARAQLLHHTLVARLPNQLPTIVDPLRIEQVVTNLIDNAIKYSPDGGQIDILLTEPEPSVVELSVRDRGVGIPAEHRAHIFDRFYQAHAGGQLTNMAGMGLGLYISRQIVELHGGTIEAQFPEDGGTRIVVRLPRL